MQMTIIGREVSDEGIIQTMVAMIHPAKILRIITVAHAPFIVSTATAANAMRASGAKTVVAMTHPIMAAPSGIRQTVEQQSHRNQRETYRETGAHARPKQRTDRTVQFLLTPRNGWPRERPLRATSCFVRDALLGLAQRRSGIAVLLGGVRLQVFGCHRDTIWQVITPEYGGIMRSMRCCSSLAEKLHLLRHEDVNPMTSLDRR